MTANGVIAAAVLLIMAPSPALAQMGVMGGLNLGTVSVSGETEDQEFRLQPGFVGGVFFGVPFKETSNIGLRVEVLFTQKGVRIDAEGVTESVRIHELEVPVLLTFLPKRGTGTNIRVLGGLTFAGILDNSSSIDGTAVTAEHLHDTEVGLKGGLQFVRGTFFYGASYTLGLTNISADATVDSLVDAVKTRTLSVVVGWNLKRAR
jgi:hypothetical protein